MANPAGRKPWAKPGLPSKDKGSTGKANATPRMGQSFYGKKRKGHTFKNAFGKQDSYKAEKPYGKKGKFFA